MYPEFIPVKGIIWKYYLLDSRIKNRLAKQSMADLRILSSWKLKMISISFVDNSCVLLLVLSMSNYIGKSSSS